MRLDTSDAGNDPANASSRHAFDLLAQGFGAGIQRSAAARRRAPSTAITRRRCRRCAPRPAPRLTSSRSRSRGSRRRAPSPSCRCIPTRPRRRSATTNLVNRSARRRAAPARAPDRRAESWSAGSPPASIDFSHVLASKLPLFFAIVILLSALLLLVIFRSLVIPLQAAIMNLLTHRRRARRDRRRVPMGMAGRRARGAEGPDRGVGTGDHVRGRVRALDGLRGVPRSRACASSGYAGATPPPPSPMGITLTGRVITAAAAIMVCVFLSFTLGDERTLKEFGFGLAVAVFLDALVVRCMLLPAVLELLGPDHLAAAALARRAAAATSTSRGRPPARCPSPRNSASKRPQSSSRQSRRPHERR